jgi:hypothetical protein
VAPKPEGSSPFSKHPATGPYPEPVKSNPHLPANLPKIHSDPILTPMPWSSEWSLSFGLSHQNLAHFPLLSHTCHMLCPPHSPWLDLPNDIWASVQIMKLLTVQLPPFSRHIIPLRSKFVLRILFSNTISPLLYTVQLLRIWNYGLFQFKNTWHYEANFVELLGRGTGSSQGL